MPAKEIDQIICNPAKEKLDEIKENVFKANYSISVFLAIG